MESYKVADSINIKIFLMNLFRVAEYANEQMWHIWHIGHERAKTECGQSIENQSLSSTYYAMTDATYTFQIFLESAQPN